MADLNSLTAEMILAIPANEPERLFTGDSLVAKGEYRALAKKWHPDHNGGAEIARQVAAHINVLYQSAVQHLAQGRWEIPNLLLLQGTDGRTRKVRYRRRRAFELGEVFISDTVLVYLVRKDASDLFTAAERQIAGFRFADAAMQGEFARYLPRAKASFETADHHVLVLEKTADVVMLRDLVDHLGGKIPPEHVAWMTSALLNIACYLSWAGLTHNDISPDTVFISPEKHSCFLLGGWWYSVPTGGRMRAATARTLANAPADLMSMKAGDPKVDLELVRATGRESLGDVTGAKLVYDQSLPRDMVDWLRLTSGGNAFQDYKTWQSETLTKSFGTRRFVKFDINLDAIYGA